jgi:hypothetical protein
MSTQERDETFQCEGVCHFGGCVGHESKLTLQDTADIFSYYVDGERQWSMGLDEMQKLYNMIVGLDYLDEPAKPV